VSYKVEDSRLILPSGVLYREGTFYLISIEELYNREKDSLAVM